MANNKEKTKVIVRQLPPALQEASFKAALDKVAEGKYNWLSFCPGKASLKKVVFTRAYINFLAAEHVFEFKAKFDGHVFVSSRGNQYRCKVEYAPFQKVPKQPEKKDPRDGTIEKDPDYQAFVKQLEEGPQLLPSATAQLEQRQALEKVAGEAGPAVVVTPLMKFLQEKYASNPNLKPGMIRRRKKGMDADADTPKKGKPPARKGADGAVAAQQQASTSRKSTSKGKQDGRDAQGKQVAAKVQQDAARSEAAAATGGRPSSSASRQPGAKLTTKAATPEGQDVPKVLLKPSSPALKVLLGSSSKQQQQKQQQVAAQKAKPRAQGAEQDQAPTRPSTALSKAPASSAGAAVAAALASVPSSMPKASSASGTPAAAGSAEVDSSTAPALAPTERAAPAKKVRAGFTAYVPGALRSSQAKVGSEASGADAATRTTDRPMPSKASAAAAAAAAPTPASSTAPADGSCAATPAAGDDAPAVGSRQPRRYSARTNQGDKDKQQAPPVKKPLDVG